MDKSNIITNKTLKELGEIMKRAQQELSLIPKDALKTTILAQNLLFSLPADYFKKIVEERSRIAETFKQLDSYRLSQAIAFMQTPFIKQISEQIARTHKYVQYTKETIEEANTILLNLGWWIYPDWTIPSLRNIIDAHKEGKDNEIEKAVIDFFSDERLDEVVKSWKTNNKLSQRMQILEDSVWAHKQRKYTLSIPALLPHVEGIINENSGRTGRITHSECLNIFKEYLNKEFKVGSLSALFPLGVLKFAENLLKEGFEWGRPSKKGRHPILHGHHVSYSDRVFSLKLILLIDFIQNLI